MTDLEKITAIRARCVELLAIAEKRTPEKWGANDNEVVQLFRGHLRNQLFTTDTNEDAHFIASCAGPAEAGWRATIAAICYYEKAKLLGWDEPSLEAIASPILTAWEGVV